MLSKAEVLDEDRVPEHELVVHRRDELNRLIRLLLRSETDLCYLIGPTGTGKTMLARLGLDKVGKQSTTAYVNCWTHYERSDILYQVADAVLSQPVHRHSTSRSQLVDRLQDGDTDDQRYVVLDEADQLTDKAVLYDLHETPQLSLVLVANSEEDLFAGMDDRTQSRLTVGRKLVCPAYSTDELAEILRKRMEYLYGTPGRRYTMRQLETVASHADGDARVAIRTLRVAFERLSESDQLGLQDDHIQAALPVAREQLRQKSLDQLNDHQRAVYDVVADHGPIAPSEIYDRYGDRVDDPRSDRSVRTYLRKLTEYNLVERQGGRQDRTYTAVETAHDFQ